MIAVVNSLSGTYFSANIPDIAFASGDKAQVTVKVDGDIIYDETLYPVDGRIDVLDMSSLVETYVRSRISCTLSVKAEEVSTGSTSNMSCNVLYSAADIDTTAADFSARFFLSLLQGRKTTALGRLEYLHYTGGGEAQVTARYSDGSTASFSATTVANNGIRTIDVSPGHFAAEGKTLVCYTVTAGQRTQEYTVDLTSPDCAPILVFRNSFGCDELIYCTGTHKVNPKFTRSFTTVRGRKNNYRTDEQRGFQADTGILTQAMVNWVDDLFRSDFVRVVNIYNGVPTIGKEIVITDSKSEFTNDDDTLPRATFEYEYAQRNHNVIDTRRVGRIFDNTFDFTFN